jgi:COP9 signalosome complex subunit 7
VEGGPQEFSLRRRAMEVEQKQADLVQQFVLLAGSARGRAAVELITHATSHPQLFAFSELLSSPHIAEVSPQFLTSSHTAVLLWTILQSSTDGISGFGFLLGKVDFYEFRVFGVVVVVQLKGTEHSPALDLLRLFAHGTWSDYKSECSQYRPMIYRLLYFMWIFRVRSECSAIHLNDLHGNRKL